LAKGESEAKTTAEHIYGQLRDQGLDVLLDDRRENPGVKFNDADLIGIPVRLTVGDRGLKKGVVEFKLRRDSERSEVPVDQAVEHVINAVRQLERELSNRVVEVPYSE
jgi:prolyl-tRNA synthetase